MYSLHRQEVIDAGSGLMPALRIFALGRINRIKKKKKDFNIDLVIFFVTGGIGVFAFDGI